MMPLNLCCPHCGASLDITKEIADAVAQQVASEAASQADRLVKERESDVIASQEQIWSEKLRAVEMQLSERDKKLTEAQTRAQQLEAKLAQGSASVRGIIAEGELYDYLSRNLPAGVCTVERVGQGRAGTDIIVHVAANGTPAGRIIIDDKWAATWQSDWAEKVWGDMQKHGADFAYIAVGLGAFPKELRDAGFGFAPCRRAGVKVGVVNRTNLPLVLALLSDTVEKILKLAEVKAVYGSTSPAVSQLKDYLTGPYETDLREKMRLMETAVKSLDDMRDKVNREHERIRGALFKYWETEGRVHQSISSCFQSEPVKGLPEIPLLGQNGHSKDG